ncbi:MAG: DUF3160 domain-containing protein [Lachnospiraceae bacterium]|nr:DUF3160 domain-containing protein [Lachnospiraceae bacterium]
MFDGKKITALIMAAATVAVSLSAGVSLASDTGIYTVDKVLVESPEYMRKTSGDLEGKEKSITRNSFVSAADDEQDILKIRPSVPQIKVKEDLSNLFNRDDYDYLSKEMKKKLSDNGFAVSGGAGYEFFEVYENNRYFQFPNFVTVDSLMHTYHLYFAHLMRNVEKSYLYMDLKRLTSDMQAESFEQYKALKGTEWEEAAKRNVEFFSVGAVLLDDKARMPKEVAKTVKSQYDLIMDASGIESCVITGDDEDYTQYKPRGYYEGDKTLEQYFRAMMWYGRVHFDQKNEDLDRSALLMTLAIKDAGYDDWDAIYTVTSFFAGASDDLGYNDLMPVIEDIYGKKVSTKDLVSEKASWKKFLDKISDLRAPRINSVPIADTKEDDNVIGGFRFMGQRFSIDETIMQELTYRRVGEFEDEDKRLLPDFLDVPAALGSEKAYELLKDMGADKYKNYNRNLNNLKKEFANNDNPLWNASLYAGWLNTLRPLLEEKGKGYPFFMQNDEWTKKDLETFAGSYTELKHDTVLYSKQMMAEMGGDWDEDKDYRGYVEPEPLVYSRFEALAESTLKGLDRLGYLKKSDKENLSRLSKLAGDLKTISVKELENKKLKDSEYELIEIYGGELEHFWLDVMKAQTGDEYPSTANYPAPLVVDVATDPNGRILEMATGEPSEILVVVPVEGKPRIATGSVYSFYQFERSLSDGRLTDDEWRKMMGFSFESYDEDQKDVNPVDRPEWTESYRCETKYENW